MKTIAILMSLVGALLLSACGCGGNEKAVAFAQSLSASRLSQLARDLNALKNARTQRVFDETMGIPKEFSDLHPLTVVVDPVMTRVYLSGCADDKVQILLRELEDGHQELVLLKGETQGEAVLWSK